MAIIQKEGKKNASYFLKKEKSHTHLVGMSICVTTVESSMEIALNMDIVLLDDTEIPVNTFLIQTQESKIKHISHTRTDHIGQTMESTRLSIFNWMHKENEVYTYVIEYYNGTQSTHIYEFCIAVRPQPEIQHKRKRNILD